MTNASDPNLNPFAATTTLEAADPVALQRSYGGIGRLAYIGLTFLAAIVYNLVLFVLGWVNVGATELLVIPVILIYFAALLWIIAQRMINTGYSPWWCVAMLVPILNILVLVRCIACPEGYADHRTLDTAGKIIAGFFLAMFGLIAIGVIMVLMRPF